MTGDVQITFLSLNKQGSKKLPENYRPVSFIYIPCKMMESIIKDKVMDHLISNQLIKDTQHGFMSNLLEFLEFVTEEFDSGHPLDVIYLAEVARHLTKCDG